MAKYIINGGKKLSGKINISGAKNAALKIIPASILGNSISTISNVPDIADIRTMIAILESIGAKITFKNNIVTIDPTGVNSFEPDEALIKKLRGAVVIIGPLLAKFHEAIFFEPGGCLIGSRPVDDHIDLFEQLDVKAKRLDRHYHLKGKPKAHEIILNKMSVTATENAIMASVLSPGITTIHAAAAEPEIENLANFLNKMGAKIQGAGTHDITIEGVSSLHGTEIEIIPDRIEAGTYLIAAIATNSKVTIGPVIPAHLSMVFKKLKNSGANFDIFEENGESFINTLEHKELKAIDIDTRTYPGFPTDLQSPFATLMTQAEGKSTLFETLFEGRFLFLDELMQMKAKFNILSPHIVEIFGPQQLEGAEINSKDLRGGAALIIAGLIASGETVLTDNGFINRGYDKMDEKLRTVGADIKKVE